MSKTAPDVEANARLLLDDIIRALQNGTKHYDLAGNLLTTPEQIVSALLNEGGVRFEPISECRE